MTQTERRRGGSVSFVVGILVGVPATIFAVSNLEATTVEFLGWTAQVPLWAVIGLSMLAGALLGVMTLLTWQTRRKHGRKKAAKREQQAVDSAPAPAGDTAKPTSTESPGGDVSTAKGRLPS